jgi:hypothetical protein
MYRERERARTKHISINLVYYMTTCVSKHIGDQLHPPYTQFFNDDDGVESTHNYSQVHTSTHNYT